MALMMESGLLAQMADKWWPEVECDVNKNRLSAHRMSLDHVLDSYILLGGGLLLSLVILALEFVGRLMQSHYHHYIGILAAATKKMFA